jgi:hypothetical protein
LIPSCARVRLRRPKSSPPHLCGLFASVSTEVLTCASWLHLAALPRPKSKRLLLGVLSVLSTDQGRALLLETVCALLGLPEGIPCTAPTHEDSFSPHSDHHFSVATVVQDFRRAAVLPRQRGVAAATTESPLRCGLTAACATSNPTGVWLGSCLCAASFARATEVASRAGRVTKTGCVMEGGSLESSATGVLRSFPTACSPKRALRSWTVPTLLASKVRLRLLPKQRATACDRSHAQGRIERGLLESVCPVPSGSPLPFSPLVLSSRTRLASSSSTLLQFCRSSTVAGVMEPARAADPVLRASTEVGVSTASICCVPSGSGSGLLAPTAHEPKSSCRDCDPLLACRSPLASGATRSFQAEAWGDEVAGGPDRRVVPSRFPALARPSMPSPCLQVRTEVRPDGGFLSIVTRMVVQPFPLMPSPLVPFSRAA